MPDFEFMTYDAAAERLEIAVSSVKRQAARRKWPKRYGNDGRVTVGIPVDRFQKNRQADSQADSVIPNPLIESLRELLEAERRRANAAESDRDAWRLSSLKNQELSQQLLDENHRLIAIASRPWWKRLAG